MRYETLIDAATLAKLIADDAVTVFDCTYELGDPGGGEAAYRAGHVPGARYLHLALQLSGPAMGDNGRHPLPDPLLFAEIMRRAGVMQGRQVVAYDRAGGPYAARLWWMLRWIGHDAVAVLDGGIETWLKAGGTLEKGEASPPAEGNVEVRVLHEGDAVDVSAVAANIEAPSFLVVDARSPERFAGEPDAFDPVAGHIPGAANRFYKHNLEADGRFKTPDRLAAEWRGILGDRPAAQAVMQCGSGVTACHNLLALAIAGMEGARLYPGSWSEWIADPTRPVAGGGA